MICATPLDNAGTSCCGGCCSWNVPGTCFERTGFENTFREHMVSLNEFESITTDDVIP